MADIKKPKEVAKFPLTCNFAIRALQETVQCTKRLELKKIGHRTGDVVILTGGARGIGADVFKKLLQCDFHIVLGLRSPSAGEKLLQSFRESGIATGSVTFLSLDLKSLKSVREFGVTVLNKFPKINILICNAGIMWVPWELTEDGIESHFQVNYLSHFLLTNILLPRLVETAETGNHAGRIVNVSSNGHWGGSIKDISEIETRATVYNFYKAYNDTKLCQVTASTYLDKLQRENGTNVYAYSVHPGMIPTELGNFVNTTPTLLKKMARSTEDGADVVVCAAASPEFEKKGGLFLMNCKSVTPHAEARNPDVQKKLWVKSRQLLHI